MFREFSNQTWTTSVTGATVTDNTDESIDGTSKKLVFTEADAWALNTFSEVNLSSWEELTLQIYVRSSLVQGNLFKITVNGQDYTFKRMPKKGWYFIPIDCQGWPAISTIKFTALVSGVTMFVDLIGYRKVTYDSMDFDIVEAIKNAISLNVGETKTLSTDATSGSKQIILTNKSYLTNTSMLRLTDGSTSEVVQLQKIDGTLSKPLVNAYDKDTTVVTLLCPVVSEENPDIESDPVCGVLISDMGSSNEDVVVPMKGFSSQGAKLKRYLGSLQVTVYIDCSHKKKLMSLCRQFDDANGDSFYILLDGEKVELYQEASPVSTPETDLGNLPRKAYFYSIEPQPITVFTKREIETITIDIDSEGL